MLISNFLITGNATVGEKIIINYKEKTSYNLNYNWQINNGFNNMFNSLLRMEMG